jgi:hypothetical protein
LTEQHKQAGPGRPGRETVYREVENWSYRVALVEDAEAIKRDTACDGVSP